MNSGDLDEKKEDKRTKTIRNGADLDEKYAGLDYHKQEGELRLIGGTVEKLLHVWQTRETNHIAVLKDTLHKFSIGDYSNLAESYPAYIKNVIENPRAVHASLHKHISLEMVRNTIKERMQWTFDRS